MERRGEVFGGTDLATTAHSRRYYVILISLVLLVVIVLATAIWDGWTGHREEQRRLAGGEPTVAVPP